MVLVRSLLVVRLSRSREGAWIEMLQLMELNIKYLGRSREGAWIEIQA